jgi:FkbH-like protein
MNQMSRSMDTLHECGVTELAAQRFAEAAEAFEAAAAQAEIPEPDLCVLLGRAHLGRGEPGAAARWLIEAAVPEAGFRNWSAAAGLLARCPVETWPGLRRRLRLGLVSTWTTATFAPLLRLAAARRGVALDIHEPDFGQYFNATLDPASALHAARPEAILLAPDHRAPGLAPFSDAPGDEVAALAARWTGVWTAARAEAKPILVQMGFADPGDDPLGHHGRGLPGSRSSRLAALDRALAEAAAGADVGFVDVARLAARLGTRAFFDDRGWHMARMPFGREAQVLMAEHAAAVLAARLGLSRRALVLDLDNTLWGGVIGDDGLEGIALGGDRGGEAFVEFQAALKALTKRGILLAVASKNDAEVALRPFREHPEMVLREEDIACFVANWAPKSENIRTIAATLNLGLDAFTFLDDNPYERAEVRRALPEVDVPVLPEDPAGFCARLADYPDLEPAGFTEADRARAAQYRARAAAEALRGEAGSLEEYQASLNMQARIAPIAGVDMARVVQLINKTNQFNLTTIRRDRAGLEAFLARPGATGFSVRLADAFADHGLIAVALAEARDGALEIDTLLMSCRVLGRGVEALILAELATRAEAMGCDRVVGRFRPSGRNAMVADLYPRHGFAEQPAEGEDRRFEARAAALTDPETVIHVTRA